MSTVLDREAQSAPRFDYPIYDADHHYYEPPEASCATSIPSITASSST
jgi:hypothetical protein